MVTINQPDEDEIRSAILERWIRPREGRLSLAAQFSDAIGAAIGVVDAIWDVANFRPSEEARFDALLSAAVTAVQHEAETKLLEAVIAALVTFAAEHPAAPRAQGKLTRLDLGA